MTCINMRKGWTLYCRVDLCPNELRGNVSWWIKSFVNVGPEMSAEEIKVNLERHKIFLFLLSKFFRKLLFIFIGLKLDLSHIFMLKLLLIRIIDFLLDFIHDIFIDYLLVVIIFLIFVIIFNHHDSFSFIMPCRLCRLLLDDFIWTFTTDEERFLQSSIDHHYIAFDSEESRIIFFFKIFKRMIFLDFLLKLLFHLIEIFLIFIKILILNIFFKLDIFELLIHLWFLFDHLLRFSSF